MGVADERGQTGLAGKARMQRLLMQTAEFGARGVRRKFDLHRLARCDGHRKQRARRRIDEPKSRAAVLDQGDIDGEIAPLLDELLGAVERIDEEEAIGQRT